MDTSSGIIPYVIYVRLLFIYVDRDVVCSFLDNSSWLSLSCDMGTDLSFFVIWFFSWITSSQFSVYRRVSPWPHASFAEDSRVSHNSSTPCWHARCWAQMNWERNKSVHEMIPLSLFTQKICLFEQHIHDQHDTTVQGSINLWWHPRFHTIRMQLWEKFFHFAWANFSSLLAGWDRDCFCFTFTFVLFGYLLHKPAVKALKSKTHNLYCCDNTPP